MQKACAKQRPNSPGQFEKLLDRLRGPGWTGGDVGVSIKTRQGQTLWFFGDSLVASGREQLDGKYSSNPQLVRNTALLLKGRCLQEVPGLLPGSLVLVPDRAGSWFWPTAGVFAGSKVYVFYQRLVSDGSGWGFRQVGVDLAVFSLLPDGLVSLDRVVTTPASKWRSGDVSWGAATVRTGGWLYVYGAARPDGSDGLGHRVHVARVRPSAVADRAAWRFWTERGWDRSSRGLVELVSTVDGPENVFSVIAQKGTSKVALVSKADGFLGGSVSLWTATSPFGVFERYAGSLMEARSRPDTGSGDELLYLGLAHERFSSLTGSSWRLGVSVSRTSTDLRRLVSSPGFYRPQFSSVTIPAP